MFDGGEYIYNQLNVSAITSQVGDDLYNSPKMPNDVEGKSINFFPVNRFFGGFTYFSRRFQINCRANTSSEARTLAESVFEILNVINVRVGDFDYFGVADILPILPPVDETDNYNVPVEILVRRR